MNIYIYIYIFICFKFSLLAQHIMYKKYQIRMNGFALNMHFLRQVICLLWYAFSSKPILFIWESNLCTKRLDMYHVTFVWPWYVTNAYPLRGHQLFDNYCQ